MAPPFLLGSHRSSPGRPTTWSVLESRSVPSTLGDNHGLPRTSSCPSYSIPCKCGQGLQLRPRVLTRQAKLTLHSRSAGGRDCEALPPSAGGLAQLRPSLQYRPEAKQLEPSQQARPGRSAPPRLAPGCAQQLWVSNCFTVGPC